ncbi:Pentatricopeptide repeat-containing protein [Nymphaea thermarum]|nr:Pentatricopeptide repeat-containing protein [Nymphaea thermarum]
MLSVAPTRTTIRALGDLLEACKTIKALKQLHAQLVLNSLHRHLFLGSKLVDSYVQVGLLLDARKVFDEIPQRNNRSWNTILSGYSKRELPSETLDLYKLMRREGLLGDTFSLVFALKACVELCCVDVGKLIHADAIKICLDRDTYVAPNLVDVYAGFGCLDDARQLFDGMVERNSVLYGVLVKGYVKSCRGREAMHLFYQIQEDGVKVEPVLVIGLLQACALLGASREGRCLHAYAVRMGFTCSNLFLSTCLVDMYAKCGLVKWAFHVFYQIQHRDVVAWTAMISGFVLDGKSLEALDLFRTMFIKLEMPNAVTVSSALAACVHLSAWRTGKSIHAFSLRSGLAVNVIVGTSLIDMYWKCGCEQYACQVFNAITDKNVCSWSAMVAGYGMHGKCHEALAAFEQMIAEGHKPNAIIFVSLLSLCSHSGLVDEGWYYFQRMSSDYGIAPSEEHYACMIDMLARAGRLLEAESFIEKMPIEPGASMWGAMLSGCKMHKNIELAERAAEKLFILEPDRADAYVLLSNIYADAGLWDQVRRIRMTMIEKIFQKTPGCSSSV